MMLNDISDEDLMMRYGEGDTEAFDVLYQRYKTPLYGFVLKQCGRESVDELFQDIWLKVINARKNYQVKASFRTWIYHLARNRIIDQHRKISIRPLDNHSDEIEGICHTSDNAPGNTASKTPERELSSQDEYECLLSAIDELPREQKEVFLLKEQAGLSIDQIAETCSISFETAKSRLRYSMKKLRTSLTENFGENR